MPERIKYADASTYGNTIDRKSDNAFYKSTAWRKCRKAFLADPANVLCADCLAKRPPVTTPTQEVHHINDRRQYPELALSFTDHTGQPNLVGLCKACHTARTRANQCL
jgi:5-methylcytosine-specific restriction endonuclease McrA